MNKARMLKAADILEADANNPKGAKFDFGTWGDSSSKAMKLECGTQACGLGVLALSGAFKRAGLSWTADSYQDPDDHGEPIGEKWDMTILFDVDDGSGEVDGIEAAECLFGIDSIVANWLFMPDAYPASKQKGKKAELEVAKRLRDLVAGTARVKYPLHGDAY